VIAEALQIIAGHDRLLTPAERRQQRARALMWLIRLLMRKNAAGKETVLSTGFRG